MILRRIGRDAACSTDMPSSLIGALSQATRASGLRHRNSRLPARSQLSRLGGQLFVAQRAHLTTKLISGGPSIIHSAGFYPPSDPACGSLFFDMRCIHNS
jgi:hypothetical protein